LSPTNTTAVRKNARIALPGLVDPHDLSVDRQFSMNLARGLQVLRAFTPDDPVLSNGEISQRTGLPRPTVSRITYTLILLGYLSRDISEQKYQLSSGVLSLGYPFLASMQVRHVARPIMAELAHSSGCTVNLGMRDRSQVVYVDTIRPDMTNAHVPDIGSTRPLLTTAIGRALVLSCVAKEQKAILNRLRVETPQLFEQTSEAWDLDRTRLAERGYCCSRGDWQRGAHGVAVPVRVPHREIPLALGCAIIPSRSSNLDLERDVVPLLVDAVHRLEQAQGLVD
jgi:DNA-binding IclR family transcriptional regulator